MTWIQMNESWFWVIIVVITLVFLGFLYPCLRITCATRVKPMADEERTLLIEQHAEKLLRQNLTHKLPNPQDVVGEYIIGGDQGTGHQYPVASFTITPEDVTVVTDGKTLPPLCPHHELGGIYGEKVAFYIRIRKANVVFRRNCSGRFSEKRATDEVVYHLSVMSNNTVRFSLPPSLSAFSALCFLWADSESHGSVLKNLVHVLRHGCFCLGMYLQEDDGTWILQRYNRWAEDVTLYWYATIHPPKDVLLHVTLKS
eukprot:gb/GEZN01012102.1/.p1 GENE.gb/GEZN01012102.1/~~gb/GEZN01012102.1/.p1  ORF type:complete len:256 (-),score=15.62 gb/GEZN01012102.1/:302-1069(-)